MELGPNSWGDLLFVCKGPNYVRSGKARWVNTYTPEAALFSWNLRIDAFKRNAGLITWTTSCTQPRRRSQLVFVPRAAETKCMLLLQGITAEKSIINPKITPFWGKGQALEKKYQFVLFGKPSCHHWLNSEWERGKLCMTKAKEEMIHHRKVW